jgi:REP element-mobilizing transposase RayT
MVTIRSRGTLPHWESPGGVYFVTFRLADSLPKPVAVAFEFERRDIMATAKAMRRELSPTEKRRLVKLFSDKYENYLDGGSGLCLLAEPRAAKCVARALAHFHTIRYLLFAWCVMPNHVHVVFQPLEGWNLSEILHAWKSYSAHEVNRILKRSASFWQREYYDHLIRNDSEFHRCVRYVLQNPVKAGLRDWPWVGTTPPSQERAGGTPALQVSHVSQKPAVRKSSENKVTQ